MVYIKYFSDNNDLLESSFIY